jgi:hypothetical protein
MIPRDEADRVRTLEDQLENPQHGFKTETTVVEQVAE